MIPVESCYKRESYVDQDVGEALQRSLVDPSCDDAVCDTRLEHGAVLEVPVLGVSGMESSDF